VAFATTDTSYHQ